MQTTLQSKLPRVDSEVAAPRRGPVLLDASMLRHVVGGVATTLTSAVGKTGTTAVSKAASTDAPRGRWA